MQVRSPSLAAGFVVPLGLAWPLAAAFVCFDADDSDFALDRTSFRVLAPAAAIRALAVVLVVAAGVAVVVASGGVPDVDVAVDIAVHQNLYYCALSC